jgi:hypothetical protein
LLACGVLAGTVLPAMMLGYGLDGWLWPLTGAVVSCGPLGAIALACAEYLVDAEFDVATSYAMQVDHGFSNVVYQLFGAIDARRIDSSNMRH